MSNNAYNHAYYAAYSAANGQQYYYPVTPPPPCGAPPSGPPTGPLIDIPGQAERSLPPPAPMPPSRPRSVPSMRRRQKKKKRRIYLFESLIGALFDTSNMNRSSIRPVSATQGYVSLPRTYPQTTNTNYRVGYRYENPYHPNQLQVVDSSARHSGPGYRYSPGRSRSSPATSHSELRVILQTRTTEGVGKYSTYQPQDPYLLYPPSQTYPIPAPLRHTCVVCGKPRSRAFHHHYPVVLGKGTIKGVCAKCRKKGHDKDDKGAEVAHRTAVIHRRRKLEPVDRSFHIRTTRAGSDEGRGRSRSSSSEDITTRRVRSLSRGHRPKSLSRTRITLRSSSESPPPTPREVTHKRTIRHIKRNEPPSPRVEFVSPVPRARSLSPVEYLPGFYDRLNAERGRVDAERRIASHSMPFHHGRTVLPDQRGFANHRSPSNSPPSALRRLSAPGKSQSRPRSTLRSPSRTRYPSPDTSRLPRARRSAESTAVEVGGPRVQFVVDPITSKRHSATKTSTEFWKSRSRDGRHHGGDGHYSGGDSRADPPPSHLQDYNYYQPPPEPSYYASRAGNAYALGPDPHDLAPHLDSLRIRDPSPASRGRPKSRGCGTPDPAAPNPPPPSPPPPMMLARDAGRERSRDRGRDLDRDLDRERSRDRELERGRDWGWGWGWDRDRTAYPPRDAEREVVGVQGYRGMDERGRPAAFVEERWTATLLVRGRDERSQRSEGGERGEGRPVVGSWRDV